ncbi:MAG: hypothetical protein OEM42_06295 [Deltaproteobacteria bacterium]|nr:hypothetical protein [Deltaproteobacteria bacterium]
MNIQESRHSLRRLLTRGLYTFPAAILLLAVHAAAGREGDFSRLLDASRDEVVRSTTVPSTLFPQAEVRLIRRDGSVVMQTVIVSRLLKTVVGEIRRKESSVWTPERAGHGDSERYIDALGRAYRAAELRFRERDAGIDHRRSLLIEFVLSEEEAFVAILDPEVRGNFGNLRVTERRVLEILPVSRHYVLENMHEIAIDSLGWSRRQAEEGLKPLLPPNLQQEGEKRDRDVNRRGPP